MKVLVINCGSSSLKYQVLDMTNENLLCKGLVERIGMDGSVIGHEKIGQEKIKTEVPMPSTTAIIDGNRGTVRHLGMVLESLGKLAPEEMDGGVEIANSDSGERIAALSRELLHS